MQLHGAPEFGGKQRRITPTSVQHSLDNVEFIVDEDDVSGFLTLAGQAMPPSADRRETAAFSLPHRIISLADAESWASRCATSPAR